MSKRTLRNINPKMEELAASEAAEVVSSNESDGGAESDDGSEFEDPAVAAAESSEEEGDEGAAGDEVLHDDDTAMEHLPVKTIKAYNRGIVKFIEWAQATYAEDALFDRVTGEKALLWMQHIAAEGKPGPRGGATRYSLSTLKSYFAGISLVYKRQVAEEAQRGDAAESWPPPLTAEVLAFFKAYAQESAALAAAAPPGARARGSGAANDMTQKSALDHKYTGETFSHAELKKVVHTGIVGRHFGDVLALLASRNLVFPLGKLRMVDLADLRVFETDTLGQVLTVARDGGFAACLRHAEVELCAHLAMASALVQRFAHAEIDFSHRRAFGELKLFASAHSSGLQPMYLLYHKKALAKLLLRAGVPAYNVAYAGTWSAAQTCRAAGVPEGVFEEFSAPVSAPVPGPVSAEAYLETVLPEPLWTLAGYASATACERALVPPLEELVHEVFPLLRRWREALASEHPETAFPEATAAEAGRTAALAREFIRTFDYLARVFIEDRGYWAARYRVLEHPVFETEAYAAYLQQQDAHRPKGVLMATTALALHGADEINRYLEFLRDDNRDLRHTVTKLEKKVSALGSALTRNNKRWEKLERIRARSDADGDGDMSPSAKRRQVTYSASDHPFVFKKSPVDVRDMYYEFCKSRDGVPCPVELEAMYGNAWRGSSASTPSQYYSRRRKIYLIVQNGISNGLTEEAAIDLLQAHFETLNISLLVYITTKITNESLPEALRTEF